MVSLMNGANGLQAHFQARKRVGWGEKLEKKIGGNKKEKKKKQKKREKKKRQNKRKKEKNRNENK